MHRQLRQMHQSTMRTTTKKIDYAVQRQTANFGDWDTILEFDHPPRSACPSAHALAARPPHAVSFSGRQTGDRDDDHTDRRGMTLYRRLTGSPERRPHLGTRAACSGAPAPGKPARTTARTGSGGNKVVRPCRAAEGPNQNRRRQLAVA